MLIIVGVALVSGGAGVRIGRRRAGKQPKPKCTCGHSLAFHDPDTHRCHGLMNGNPVRFDTFNDPTAWEKVPCGCRQYVGPVPADQMLTSFVYPKMPEIDKPPATTTDDD